MLTKSVYFYNFNRRAVLAAGLVGACALLAGCTPQGNGGNSASGAKGGPVTVHLAYFPNVTHATALVGSGRGTFAKALQAKNATIDEKTFTAGPSEMEALFAGAVDIGFTGPGPAINAYLKSGGQALRIIGGASSGGAGLIARSDANITDLAGLRGKRVAVPQTGGTQDISLRHFLADASLTPKNKGGDVDVVQYAPANIAQLFDRRELDAAYVPEPWLSVLQEQNKAKLIFDERDKWPGKKFATTVIVARKEFLDAHPDLVKAFLDAHLENVEWANAHQAEARAVVGKRIKEVTTRTLPDSVIASALSRTELTSDPIPQSVLTFADWGKQLGYVKDGAPMNAIFALDPLNESRSSRKLPPVSLAAPSAP